ncbi:putative actin binding protein [Aspergillus tanneri]|uniref:Actin binding protein n=1 Tax=Aspergillus tanneri TaxID=1220188 RepID=A0A5M9MD22_9EURO|nr:uncharacterized protein ATNIH1004_009084 [Aspergillus tanneri]KAA8644875.1 hypothetical protein ATNIH1004_009084 [Aspergillus tanneri]
MATLNLSSNGASISKSYETVVNSALLTGSLASSPTYCQWAVFSVSTPLISAFQQDAGNKESILKVQSTGEGELTDLIDEFSEGKVQFAFAKVTDPNTGLPKNVLIAWCGEGVPERTKGYFTSHLSAVSKFLHGYHVQITARSDADLTAEGIVQKVSDASGAKYTLHSEPSSSPAPPPPASNKPVFTPSRSGGIVSNKAPPVLQRDISGRNSLDDGWGPDAPPITRTQLEKVQPAYKPTKVNINELRSDKSPIVGGSTENATEDRSDIIKGGYRPVGRVDIAAIRRQALEAGEFKDDRPGPVKGVYEPVGKVDIAAIRSKAQKSGDDSSATNDKTNIPANAPITGQTKYPEHPSTSTHSERLTSLPKPKVSNKFGIHSTFAGTKPAVPNDSMPKTKPGSAHVGSASRTFADERGKTPAQLWAEKKARERGEDSSFVSSFPSLESNKENSGDAEWKGSCSGKNWDPVQTVHTEKFSDNNIAHQASHSVSGENLGTETRTPQQNITAIQDTLARGSSVDSPTDGPDTTDAQHAVPSHFSPTGSAEQQTREAHEPEVVERISSQPHNSRPPTPPSPAREASPIRVAMPVGRGAADLTDEEHVSSPNISSNRPRQIAPSETDLQVDPQDTARATDRTTTLAHSQGGGVQALVQYDYEKAEDNEIELREGEYVTDIEMVDKDWWLGSNMRGERGLFPSNYVEVAEHKQQGRPTLYSHESQVDTPDLHAASAAPLPSGLVSNLQPSAMALYDYEAAEDNELSFPEGAEITGIP